MTSPVTPTETVSPAAAQARPAPGKRRWLRSTLLFLLVVVVAYGGFFAFARYQRSSILSRLTGTGEQPQFSQYVSAFYAKNASTSPSTSLREAIDALKKQKGARGESLPTSATYSLAEKTDWRPLAHQKIQAELKAAAPALAAVRESAKSPPRCVISEEEFRREGEQLPALEHLPMISRLVALLALERVDALAKGNARSAFECVRTSFQTAESLADEPWLRSQQRRLDAFETTAAQLFRCLGDAAATDEEYRQFERIAAGSPATASAKETVRVEFAKRFGLLDDPRLFREATAAYMGRLTRDDSFDRKLLGWKYDVLTSPLARPLVYLVQADLLQDFQAVLGRGDAPAADGSSATHAPPFDDVMKPLFMTRVDRVEDELDFALGLRRSALMTRWGLRVCRWYDAKGALPERLEDVCDPEMPSIDVTLFLGKPPEYTRSEKGFTLEAGVRSSRSKSLSLVSESVRVQFSDKRLGRPPEGEKAK